MRTWLHYLVRRWLFRLFMATQPAAIGSVDGSPASVSMLRWLWNDPDPGLDPKLNPPPIFALEVREVGVPERRAAHIVMSPAQVLMLCRFGAGAVEKQAAQFHDAEPRDFDVRNVEVRS